MTHSIVRNEFDTKGSRFPTMFICHSPDVLITAMISTLNDSFIKSIIEKYGCDLKKINLSNNGKMMFKNNNSPNMRMKLVHEQIDANTAFFVTQYRVI